MWTLTDSIAAVVVQPEYDIKCTCKKIESQHRTTNGKKFVYKWGDYYAASMSVRWVSEADKLQLNAWWKENTRLMWYPTSDTTQVESVLFVNKEAPIGAYEAPYIDQFKGKIQLESY